MKTNKIIGLLFLLILILVGARLAYTLANTKSVEADAYKGWWQYASPNEVARITIEKEATKVELTKAGADWQVDNYKAKSTEIQEWLPLLLTPADPEVAAETAASHEQLGITAEAARMTVQVGGADKQLVIGNNAVGGRYIRLDGGETVYLVKGLPDNLDSVKTADWIDKTVVRIAKDSIDSMTWQRQKQEFKVIKEGENFKNEKGETLDTTILNPMVMSLESLVVQGIKTPEEDDEWQEEPEFTLSVTRNGQEPVELNFYESPTGKVLTTSTQPGFYTLNEATYKNFDLQATDLAVK